MPGRDHLPQQRDARGAAGEAQQQEVGVVAEERVRALRVAAHDRLQGRLLTSFRICVHVYTVYTYMYISLAYLNTIFMIYTHVC